MKTEYIWKNWEFIKWEDCMEHHVNHSLHYWSGVFEGIRFYPTPKWPKIFRLREHIERLFYSAKVMNLNTEFTVEDIMEACLQSVQKSWIESWYIRPIMYHESWTMWLKAKNKINVTISVWAWWKYLSENPISVKIPKVRRLSKKTADMNAKVCWYYANSILASLEIQKGWFDEWLLLDTKGNIAEWPGENIFFVDSVKNKIYTPATGNILPWITRDSIIKILKKDFDIEVKETKIKPDELWDFNEAFFVWTAAEVTIIWSITDKKGKTHKYASDFSKKIKEFYQDIVTWENSWYEKWLY